MGKLFQAWKYNLKIFLNIYCKQTIIIQEMPHIKIYVI